MLVAIEGIDGAGKNTLAAALSRELPGAGRLAFPRYGESVHADLARGALDGHVPELAASPWAMATLFALDRAGAKDELERAAAPGGPLLILDRYVASNAAYTAARLERDPGEVADAVGRLEYGELGLPKPTLQVLLPTDVDEADRRARGRERSDPGRSRDAYERDGGLQRRTAAAYAELAERGFGGEWLVASSPAALAERIRRA